MSRSGYDEGDCDSNFCFLWPTIVRRSINGKRGQAFLLELRAALDAMPNKRLIAEELRTPDGEVCAIGSVGVKRGVDMSKLDVNDAGAIAKAFGVASALVCEIEYVNDQANDYYGKRTPERRWQDVRDWVERNLKAE